MSLSEKLQAFEAYIINQANAMRKQNLEALAKEMEREALAHTEAIKKDLDKKLDAQYQNMIISKNKKSTIHRYNLLQDIVAIKNQHQAEVIAVVRSKLQHFANSTAYLPYLENSLAPISHNASKIIVSKGDIIYLERLHKLNDNIVATGDFIGGFIAYMPPNILIDKSFASHLNAHLNKGATQ